MGQPLQLVIGLLACLALASALPGLFPRNKITTYRYYADVKTGTIEPKPFASQFVISGYLHITPEIRDANLKNAYYVLLNVTHGIRNGEIQHFDRIENTFPIPEDAKVLNDPFVIVFEENGKVKSLMMNEREAGWSKNFKQSIASMLQLDLSSMNIETPIKPHAFLTKENTIYGECAVAYDVQQELEHGEKHFTVTKIMEPMSCDKFNQHTFNARKSGSCMIDNEEEMTTSSRRVFHIDNTGEDLLIKTLVAHGVINYLPWNGNSEAHYILANQTLEYESLTSVDSMTLPELIMKDTMTLNDVSYQKSRSLYAVHAGVDPTYGRHVVNLEALMTELIRMLGVAVDYMNENNVEITSPEMLRGQTINRILDTMTRLDVPSLEHVFNNITGGTSMKELMIMDLFLNIVPYVGTNATCLFARNIIRKHKISDQAAITMLTTLPFHIRFPTNSLLIEMEDFMNLGDDMSLEVRKAGIICFSNLIYKTHEHESDLHTVDIELINRYVQHYFDRIMAEPTYEMKLTYMHGMRNIEVGNVHNLLEPMIRGDQEVSERPEHLRFHAMLVNWRKPRDMDYIHDLYWPILSNRNESMLTRVCAYTILIEQPPRMDRLMNLHWLMASETNEHVYNYHYTTIKSLANTVNPCMTPLKEMAKKILRFTRVRPANSVLMSGVWMTDYVNKEFGFGESLTTFAAAHENTGTPNALSIDYTSMSGRRPVNNIMLWLRVEGVDIMQDLFWNTTLTKPDISIKEIENVLRRASEDMPSKKPIHIEYVIMVQNRVVFSTYLDQLPDVSGILAMVNLVARMKFWQYVGFDELYTMQVPNDIGLPTMLHNKIPRVMTIQSNNHVTSATPPLFGAKLDTVFNGWRHGYHSMEVYNPIVDTWHAVRRVSSYDLSLPISMSISYNLETKSFKWNLPRLPRTSHSITGVRSYVENYVMVNEVDDGILERYCGNCHQSELVTRGAKHRRTNTIVYLDSKDTGLRLNVQEYDCERVNRPVSRCESFSAMLNKRDKNSWGNNAILALLSLREEYMHGLINPELGNCGYLARLEPSVAYPMSEVDITMRMNVEVPTAKVTSLFPATRFNFRGTLNARAMDMNTSVQSWTLNANIGTSQGYINNQMQIQMTRTTPGQTDYKVCIEGFKIYPAIEADPFKRDSTTKQEIISKLTINMGESENGTCVRDGVTIMISSKAELSDEQKEAIEYELVYGKCKKDMENPIYMYTETSIVPRTPACIREAMLRTTMRKYSHTLYYKNIPESIMPTIYWIADDMRSSVLNELNYLPAHTELGIMKIFTEYPLDDESMNMVIRTPTHEEKYTGIVGLDFDELSSDLENTQFSRNFIDDVEQKQMRFCVVYPEILLNTDGAVMPFTVPTEWTLLTGDYIGHMFSVFVKRFEPNNLGLLMTVANHTIQVIPSATNPTVTVDGNIIDHVDGITISGGTSYILRTAWNQNRLVIQSEYTSFDLEWTAKSIALAMRMNLQGKVTGLCGHLDGTHTERMTRVYSFGS